MVSDAQHRNSEMHFDLLLMEVSILATLR